MATPRAGEKLLVVSLRGTPAQKIPEGKVGRYAEEIIPAAVWLNDRWWDLRTMNVVHGTPIPPSVWRNQATPPPLQDVYTMRNTVRRMVATMERRLYRIRSGRW